MRRSSLTINYSREFQHSLNRLTFVSLAVFLLVTTYGNDPAFGASVSQASTMRTTNKLPTDVRPATATLLPVMTTVAENNNVKTTTMPGDQKSTSINPEENEDDNGQNFLKAANLIVTVSPTEKAESTTNSPNVEIASTTKKVIAATNKVVDGASVTQPSTQMSTTLKSTSLPVTEAAKLVVTASPTDTSSQTTKPIVIAATDKLTNVKKLDPSTEKVTAIKDKQPNSLLLSNSADKMEKRPVHPAHKHHRHPRPMHKPKHFHKLGPHFNRPPPPGPHRPPFHPHNRPPFEPPHDHQPPHHSGVHKNAVMGASLHYTAKKTSINKTSPTEVEKASATDAQELNPIQFELLLEKLNAFLRCEYLDRDDCDENLKAARKAFPMFAKLFAKNKKNHKNTDEHHDSIKSKDKSSVKNSMPSPPYPHKMMPQLTEQQRQMFLGENFRHAWEVPKRRGDSPALSRQLFFAGPSGLDKNGAVEFHPHEQMFPVFMLPIRESPKTNVVKASNTSPSAPKNVKMASHVSSSTNKVTGTSKVEEKHQKVTSINGKIDASHKNKQNINKYGKKYPIKPNYYMKPRPYGHRFFYPMKPFKPYFFGKKPYNTFGPRFFGPRPYGPFNGPRFIGFYRPYRGPKDWNKPRPMNHPNFTPLPHHLQEAPQADQTFENDQGLNNNEQQLQAGPPGPPRPRGSPEFAEHQNVYPGINETPVYPQNPQEYPVPQQVGTYPSENNPAARGQITADVGDNMALTQVSDTATKAPTTST